MHLYTYICVCVNAYVFVNAFQQALMMIVWFWCRIYVRAIRHIYHIFTHATRDTYAKNHMSLKLHDIVSYELKFT